MARGPLPRLPALAAAPRLHPSPRGRRGGRARSLADSSGGFAAATESWGRARRGPPRPPPIIYSGAQTSWGSCPENLIHRPPWLGGIPRWLDRRLALAPVRIAGAASWSRSAAAPDTRRT